MSNTPNMRFKGFTAPWEQRRLEDVTEEFKSGSFIAADDIEEYGKYPVYGGNGLRGYANTYNHDGEFALIGRQGALCGNMNYCVGKAYFTEHAVAVKANNTSNTRFLYYLLDKMNLGQYSDQSAQPGLAVGKLIKLENMFPSKQEQEKIGIYFRSLDTLITLHQRKCDEMSELKKYMLQKMFPRNREQFPEIRFCGFTDPWEQCKLGGLVEKYEDPVETLHDGYERLGIRSHAKGTFHSYVDAGKELEAAKMHRVAADKFIVNITFAWEHAVAITDDEDAGLLVSHRFPQFSFHKELKSRFFKYMMLDKKFREHLELSSPGGAGRNRVLKIDDMLKYNIKFPCIEEQAKISAYFDNLDNLITLHQRKCDELKAFKKFMLQNMFPKKG